MIGLQAAIGEDELEQGKQQIIIHLQGTEPAYLDSPPDICSHYLPYMLLQVEFDLCIV